MDCFRPLPFAWGYKYVVIIIKSVLHIVRMLSRCDIARTCMVFYLCNFRIWFVPLNECDRWHSVHVTTRSPHQAEIALIYKSKNKSQLSSSTMDKWYINYTYTTYSIERKIEIKENLRRLLMLKMNIWFPRNYLCRVWVRGNACTCVCRRKSRSVSVDSNMVMCVILSCCFL